MPTAFPLRLPVMIVLVLVCSYIPARLTKLLLGGVGRLVNAGTAQGIKKQQVD